MSGDAVYCNCCERSFSRFLDMGGRYEREGVVCPNCASLERQRLLWSFLQEVYKIESVSMDCMHFAPSYAIKRNLKRLLGKKYRNADLYDALADECMDLHDLPLADESFDLILISHVLSHVKDDLRVLSELKRILKPNASLLIMERINPDQASTISYPEAETKAEKLKLYGQDDLERIYGADFHQLIEAAGFSVKVLDHYSTIDTLEAQKMRLSPLDLIYHCTANA